MSQPPSPPRHRLWDPVRRGAPPPPGATCGTCTWRTEAGTCLRHDDAVVYVDEAGCPAWTGPLDCAACGACCRQAFHVVEVEADEPFARRHPELLTREEGRQVLPRPGGFCAALVRPEPPWTCRHYADRPRSCRDFPVGGESCLLARRRVDLTP